jgi:hypothetical protein
VDSLEDSKTIVTGAQGFHSLKEAARGQGKYNNNLEFNTINKSLRRL